MSASGRCESRSLVSRELRFSSQPGSAASLLLSGHIVHILHIKLNLLLRPNLPLDLVLDAMAANAQVDRVSGMEFAHPAFEVRSYGMAIEGENIVAGCQASTLRFATRAHADDRRRGIEIVDGEEAGIGDRAVTRDGAQTSRLKKIVPGNLVKTRYVLFKKCRQLRLRNFFSGCAHSVRIRKELALLRVVLVHGLKHVAQRGLAVAGLTDLEVQHLTQQFPLVVVRDAARRLAIKRIFFQPRIQT